MSNSKKKWLDTPYMGSYRIDTPEGKMEHALNYVLSEGELDVDSSAFDFYLKTENVYLQSTRWRVNEDVFTAMDEVLNEEV